MTYYYTHNSRGDIVGIYNGAGQLRAHYEYDAWGNILSVTDENGNAITGATHIGNLNPFRYRGYYYDTESGFYYLMSRYYDPVTHRFINCDGYFQSGRDVLDANMSAYCRNNPINCYDPTGNTTWKEVQTLLASDEQTNFTIQDVTTAQKLNFGPNDDVPFLTAKMGLDSRFGIGIGAVTYGSYKGYTWNIHTVDTSTKTNKHIHIEAFGKTYSQNIDGSPHDGSTGSPPNTMKKHLKERGIWDWDANQEKYDNSNIKLMDGLPVMQPVNSSGLGLYVMPLDVCTPSIALPQINCYFSPSLSYGFCIIL